MIAAFVYGTDRFEGTVNQTISPGAGRAGRPSPTVLSRERRGKLARHLRHAGFAEDGHFDLAWVVQLLLERLSDVAADFGGG